ncbi:MAG: peptidase S41 [Proteobacteria bacterium]|nr:peptidase S41 [Pseudomonadota bacterium]
MTNRFVPSRTVLTAIASAALLAACGGGGSDDTPPVSGTNPQVCSPNNPYRADAGGRYVNGTWTTVSYTNGSISTEKSWLQSYMTDAYLWYSQMPSVNASLSQYSNDTPAGFYPSIDGYFEALKTPARTATGALLDRFSFTYPTKLWADLIGSGTSGGYGIEWSVTYDDPTRTETRHIKVAYVEVGSAVAALGITRGDEVLQIDGVAANVTTEAGRQVLNAGLSPDIGANHTFVIARNGVTLAPLTLTGASITADPVPNTHVDVVNGKRIGYILFNSHTAASEAKLIASVNSLAGQGIDDLVLDVRYNGGGYLYVASELAYMIAGSARTAGKTFEKLQYNDKRTADNNRAPTEFFSTSNSGATLPSLNLGRVTVLTTGNTCSASEAIINSLRGVGVTVTVVGGTTCGKPYGFTAKDNCGISYFPIEFKGVNNVGFGDYADGFAPNCAVADDLSQPLGSRQELQYATAVGQLLNGSCSPVFARAEPRGGVPNVGGRILRGPERENRILLEEGRVR